MIKIAIQLLVLLFFFVSCFKVKSTFYSTKIPGVEVTLLGKFSEEEAKQISQSRIQILMKALAPQYDPYTGLNTLPEKCQKQNVPDVIMKNTEKDFYFLVSIFSSKNRSIGICSDLKYIIKTQYLIFYCKHSKDLAIAKYFYDESKSWILDPLASCRQ